MTNDVSRIDRRSVVVGKPLPFSIYGTDKTLLLAQGQLVKSERVRDALIRNGVLLSSAGAHSHAATARSEEARTTLSALAVLRHDYMNLTSRARIGLRMAREDGGDSYLCWVIGYTDRRGLIITAPCREDRNYVTVTEGQSWLFRTFYATAAFRFSATIQKVLFDPFPYLHIQLPQLVDMRLVRRMTRAQVCLNATVEAEEETAAVIVDMSVSGLRLALAENSALSKDQSVNLNFTVPLLDQQYSMKLQGRIVSCYGAADAKHPRVAFFGLNLEPITPHDQVILHAYVQQHLVSELDSLWQALAMDVRS